MKKTVKLLTSACCEKLLTFQSDTEIRRLYSLPDFPDAVLEKLGAISRYSIEDTLSLSPDPKDDARSSIDIFSELKDLDRVQANDRRLWVALTHGPFFAYTKARWVRGEEYSDEAI